MSMSDCSRRLGIVLSIFAGAIAVFGLMLVPAGAQPDPAQATTASGDSDGADDLAVRIPAPPDCLAKAGNWAEPEKWAWQQICAREAIDFDERYKKNGKKPDIDSLKSDPNRRLGASFVREIFENPGLSSIAQNASIQIVGAYIPAIQLTDTTIGSLVLVDSQVGDISVEGGTILRSFRVAGSHVGDINLSRTKGGDISISNSHSALFSGMLLNVGRLSTVGSTIGRFELRISRLSQQLAILSGSFTGILADDVKSDGLFVRPQSVQSVSLNDYVDSGMFFLEVKKWAEEPSLKISTMTSGRFFLRSKIVPAKVSISGFSFAGGDWGDNPLPYLKANQPYNPALYTNLATSYAEAGQPDVANSILVEKQNAEYRNTSSVLDKSYLFMTWLLADYGYRPEIGLLWIIAFVLVSALIFKSGAHCIRQGNLPGNWFVFAFDSVIPGIQLNKEHADVQFFGWRQGFLYFLRFLGAVVVVLVIEMLKKSFNGL